MRDLSLRINGRDYAGWKSARVTRGIETVCGGFALSVADRWAGQQEPWPIREEDECALLLGDERVITGYVDGRTLSFGPEEHAISVSGRDAASALVDCSADLDKWEFSNFSVLDLAKKVGDQFGLRVSLQAGLQLAQADKLSVDPGDTGWDVLERLCRTAGVLAVSDGDGGIVLTRVGSEKATTALEEGQNILQASLDCDATKRFSAYRVLAQERGSDRASGKTVAAVRGVAVDEGVQRVERLLIVRGDGGMTPAQAKTRAQWEATVRAARAHTVNVTVQGWEQGDGSLWPVNALVRIKSPLLGLDTEMLIKETVFSLDEGGTTTELALSRPDAFKPEPEVRAKPEKKGGKVPPNPWLKGKV